MASSSTTNNGTMTRKPRERKFRFKNVQTKETMDKDQTPTSLQKIDLDVIVYMKNMLFNRELSNLSQTCRTYHDLYAVDLARRKPWHKRRVVTVAYDSTYTLRNEELDVVDVFIQQQVDRVERKYGYDRSYYREPIPQIEVVEWACGETDVGNSVPPSPSNYKEIDPMSSENLEKCCSLYVELSMAPMMKPLFTKKVLMATLAQPIGRYLLPCSIFLCSNLKSLHVRVADFAGQFEFFEVVRLCKEITRYRSSSGEYIGPLSQLETITMKVDNPIPAAPWSYGYLLSRFSLPNVKHVVFENMYIFEDSLRGIDKWQHDAHPLTGAADWAAAFASLRLIDCEVSAQVFRSILALLPCLEYIGLCRKGRLESGSSRGKLSVEDIKILDLCTRSQFNASFESFPETGDLEWLILKR